MAPTELQMWLEQFCAGVDMPRVAVLAGARKERRPVVVASVAAAAAAPASALMEAAARAIESRVPIVASSRDAPDAAPCHIAVPILASGQVLGALAADLSTNSRTSADSVLQAATAAATILVPQLAAIDGESSPATVPGRSLALLQEALLAAPDLGHGLANLASALLRVFGCREVAIGLTDARHCVLRTLASGPLETADAAHLGRIAAAMDEAADQCTTIRVPASPGPVSRVTLAHSALIVPGTGAAATIPLVADLRTVGAVTMLGDDELSDQQIAFFEASARTLGPLIALRQRAEASWHARLCERLRRATDSRQATWRSLFGIVALVSLGLISAIPVDYRVTATARLEGETQRALAAPAAGFVRKALARPGDAVNADQLLVELGTEDMEVERQRWLSEEAQHANGARAALARGDRAGFVTSAARAEEARARTALVTQQMQRTAIRAPFAGIVISGDLTQALGSPVERGEVLMRLAPADRYRLIVAVDERDVAQIATGARGQLTLTALPHTAVGIEVVRITPLATERDGRNVFEAEARLVTTPGAARPGLEGIAKIDAGRRSLGWVWLHGIADWLRLATWTWLG